MNDSLFGSLISDVINHRHNASISFYTNLPKFYCAALESPDSSKVLIELIQFITQWCQISDGFATRILMDNLQYLLPPDDKSDQSSSESEKIVPKKNYDIILQSFSKLLKTIIEELGSFISPQLQQFVTIFRPKVKDNFFDDFVFPTLFSIFELDETLSDSVATAIRFISNFLDVISESNIARLIEKIKFFSDSPQMHIRLAVVDTFPLFCVHEPTLFETVFLKFFNDSDTCIKTHFISVIANSFPSKTDVLIPFATDANWKLRYSYIENCSQFIATNKEIEDIFYQLAHYDPEIILRAEALHRLATCEDLKIEVKIEKAIAEEKDEVYKPDQESESKTQTDNQNQNENQQENDNENDIIVYDSVNNPNGSKLNKFSNSNLNYIENNDDIIPVIDESRERLDDDNEAYNQNPIINEGITEDNKTLENENANSNEQANINTSNLSLDENGNQVNSEGNIVVHSSNEGDEGEDDSSSSSSDDDDDDESLEFGVHTSPMKPSTTFSSISPLNSGGPSPLQSKSIISIPPDPSYLTVFKNDEKLMNLCRSNIYVRLCINSLCSKYKHIRISGCELACKLQVTAICFRRAVFTCARTQRELEIIMKGYIPYCRWNEGTRGEQCVLSIVKESLRNPDWRTALSALTCISLFITDKVKMKRSRRNSILKALRENETSNNESGASTNTNNSTNSPEKHGGFSIESACIRYGNAFLALKLFGEVLLRIESPNFCVRQEAVEQIINFVRCFGWDFYVEKVHQKVIGFTKSNRRRTQRISLRILRKMLKLNPPEDIKEKIVAALEPFDKMMEE